MPARGDPNLPFPGSDLTPQFAPFVKIASDALWRHQILAFWNPFVLCGAPFFETPQAGVISLSTLLGGFLGYVAAVKMSMLIHVLAGMIGAFAFARWLNTSRGCAAAGALLFGLGGFLFDHFKVGHLNVVYAMAIMPWVWLVFVRAIEQPRLVSGSAFATSALIALQVLEGGDSAVLYEVLAMALAVPVVFLVVNSRTGYRTLCILVLVTATAFALAAFQLIPMMSYISLTNRSGGIPLPLAAHPFHESRHPFPGVIALILAAAALANLWRSSRKMKVAIIWLEIVLLAAMAVASFGPLFSLLWHVVPGFSYQRIPERALLLAGVACPILAACGLDATATFLQGYWGKIRANALLSAIVVAAGLECWLRGGALPPMASVSRELAANKAMQWVKDHANGARMHIAEISDRNWGAEHQTVPLGLEVIAGYTPSDHRDYLSGELDSITRRTFLTTSYQNPAPLWGMLSVRFLLSTIPRSVPGFRLATITPACPVEICQPRPSSGPYIYENEHWLPRAWSVKHVVALVGNNPEANFQATLDVLQQHWFDPASLVVIQVESAKQIPAADLIFSTGSITASEPPWNADALEAVHKLAQSIERGVVAAGSFDRPDLNRIRITGTQSGWMVVSERIGLFPGWTAEVDGRRAPIERANGVLGAIYLTQPSQIDLHYRPPGFAPGMAISASGLLLISLWKIFCARSRVFKGSSGFET